MLKREFGLLVTFSGVHNKLLGSLWCSKFIISKNCKPITTKRRKTRQEAIVEAYITVQYQIRTPEVPRRLLVETRPARGTFRNPLQDHQPLVFC
jgi:hypothetical protein